MWEVVGSNPITSTIPPRTLCAVFCYTVSIMNGGGSREDEALASEIREFDFEKQFAQPESIPFRGGYVQVWDLRQKRETPNSLPIVFIPGWGASPRVYKDSLRIYHASGRRVVTVAFSPKVEEVEKEGIPRALFTKAIAVLHVLKEKRIQKADAIGYSEGTVILQIAAHEEACRFRNFVFQAPTSLMGKSSYIQIFKMEFRNLLQLLRVARNVSPEEKERIERKRKDVLAWFQGRGFIAGGWDGIQPGRFEASYLFEKLQQCPEQHRIGIIAAKDDQMIDFEKVAKRANELQVASFEEIQGGHQTFEIKAIESAEATKRILHMLENSHQ